MSILTMLLRKKKNNNTLIIYIYIKGFLKLTFCILWSMIVIGLQFPYAMVVGWELFGDKEVSNLGFKSVVLHLLLISIEIQWDHDE